MTQGKSLEQKRVITAQTTELKKSLVDIEIEICDLKEKLNNLQNSGAGIDISKENWFIFKKKHSAFTFRVLDFVCLQNF